MTAAPVELEPLAADKTVMTEDEQHQNGGERRSGKDRRTGEDRRKPRSAFVERIGWARNRRTGGERRTDTDRRSDG